MHSTTKADSFINFLRDKFSGKKVLILGFGKEGQSSFSLFKRHLPDIQLVIADRNPGINELPILLDTEDVNIFSGEDYLDAVAEADEVIKSPGVKIPEEVLQGKQHIYSQTDLFIHFYREQIIGVTGTKGKSTTATLIYHILNKVGKNVLLLGNIGVPAFEKVEQITNDDLIVFELSAHQLESATASPHIAVLLNIFPEHLDYFKDFEAYKRAKENIFRYQTNEDFLILLEAFNSPTGSLKPTAFSFDDEKNVRRIKDHIKENQQKIPLAGVHNQLNISAAILVAELVGISVSESLSSLQDFQSLPHRLEYVGKIQDIHFYNDSISTVPESAIAAVSTFENVDTIILGGYDRGLDYAGLVDFLMTSNISNFIFLGKAGKVMLDLFNQKKEEDFRLIQVASLEEAFPFIFKHTKPGAICLLSPAASSYDQFHNFEHRGDTFRELAKNLEQ